MQNEALDEMQIKTMRSNLVMALNYHYRGFELLQKIVAPSVRFPENYPHMKEWFHIKYEFIAYLAHLKRFKHFMNNMRNKRGIVPPNEENLKSTWDKFEKGGLYNFYFNKWAIHRSYDYPTKEDTSDTHFWGLLLEKETLGVLQNEDKIVFLFAGHYFIPSQEHNKILNFLKWFFEEIVN